MFVIMYKNEPHSVSADVERAFQEAAHLLKRVSPNLEQQMEILFNTFNFNVADFGAGDVRVMQVTNLDEF